MSALLTTSLSRLYLSQWRFVLQKILWLFFVFFGITLVSFLVIHLAPGSPIDMETTMNPLADVGAQKKLAAIYGLDKPLLVQYWDWVLKICQFDFGTSMSSDARPVMEKILQAMPLTLWINVSALILTLILSISIGVISAYKAGSLFDSFATIFVFIGFSIPSFWLALLLMIFFCIDLQWLPLSGLQSLHYNQLSSTAKVMDMAKHLALPLFIIVIGNMAAMSRFVRASVLEVLRQDFITTAKAKGLSHRLVLFRHALGNALLPLITLLGLSIPGLIGGSVIIESIFSLPGMGRLFYTAIMARDYPLIMGTLVLGAFLTLAGNIIADVAYGMADPRIRQRISK